MNYEHFKSSSGLFVFHQLNISKFVEGILQYFLFSISLIKIHYEIASVFINDKGEK